MKLYYRPIVQSDLVRPAGAMPLAGGPFWFDRVEVLSRSEQAQSVATGDAPTEILKRLTSPRAPVLGFDWARPVVMGVLNVTPDSFSDGGKFHTVEKAVVRGLAIEHYGADIIDIGGESTRPGADHVNEATEVARVVPVVAGLKMSGLKVPISVDTRRAGVARASILAGAAIFNDVSALSHDLGSLAVAAETGVAVCLMHSPDDLAGMQDDPRYDDVLLDVYDHLEERIATCEAAGISRAKIIVDVGIGFGKTLAHNLALLQGLSLFHGLGCPILLGVSRKRFIGALSGEKDASRRGPGSIAAALEGLRQGVQIIRVHDIAETAQAVAVWRALQGTR